MRAARWTTPSLRLWSVVPGTSQLPAPFEPNPTLLRPPLPSQCPTESTEGILPHPILMKSIIIFLFRPILVVHNIQFTCELILDSIPPTVKQPDVSTHISESMEEVFLHSSKNFHAFININKYSLITIV